jgi:hypothetical protein
MPTSNAMALTVWASRWSISHCHLQSTTNSRDYRTGNFPTKHFEPCHDSRVIAVTLFNVRPPQVNQRFRTFTISRQSPARQKSLGQMGNRTRGSQRWQARSCSLRIHQLGNAVPWFSKMRCIVTLCVQPKMKLSFVVVTFSGFLHDRLAHVSFTMKFTAPLTPKLSQTAMRSLHLMSQNYGRFSGRIRPVVSFFFFFFFFFYWSRLGVPQAIMLIMPTPSCGI